MGYGAGRGADASMEVHPASLRSASLELRNRAELLAAQVRDTVIDDRPVAGSRVAEVLSHVGPVLVASVEASSARMMQFSVNLEDCASAYEQADDEFARCVLESSNRSIPGEFET
ncbi:hypothetical protein CH292_10425 [Rhodococcus sp. 14-2470-1a]|nr:hypothetical protein CH292_10425 [Rhodococcus sp. 14-2470-1a]